MVQSGSPIEVWLVDLERCAAPLEVLERSTPRLAGDDYRRAEAIRDARERRHRIATYCALRILLERVAGPEARCRPFVRSASGKPALGIGAAEFSLSHIDGLALIGISSALPLGVDLEQVRPIKMAPRRLIGISAAGSGLGSKPLASLGTERTFLQAWARLEAFTKARDRGLAQTLTDLGVRSIGRQRLSPAAVEGKARQVSHSCALVVHDLALQPALHAAVCSPRGVRPARARMFPADQPAIERLIGEAQA